ncbi:MAG: O-antigen ligase family protein [Hyphomicrobiaceae bacterium]
MFAEFIVIVETTSAERSRTADRAGHARAIMIVTACMVAFAIVFPRSTTTLFLIPAVVALAAWFVLPAVRMRGFPLNAVSLAVLGFAGWSLLSAGWSAAPLASLTKPLFMIAGAAGIAVLAGIARDSEPEILAAAGHGILFGFLGGAAMVCFETVTDQAISQWFVNTFAKLREGFEKQLIMKDGVVVRISDTNINRRATVVTLLMAPAALLLTTLAESAFRRWATALFVAICAILLVFSSHQSSQAAILAGAIAFGLAKLTPAWTCRSLAAAWCAACLLVVPFASLLHNANLHKNDAVFNSARHRVVIWNATAEGVKKSPVIGIGADATATLTLIQKKAQEAAGTVVKDGAYDVTTGRHAHNVFLQVWYELGGIGALLFLVAGLASLAQCMKAPAKAQPFLLAQFAVVAAMIAFSFSVWQLWLQGAVGLGLIAILTALAAPAFQKVAR